MTEQAIADTYSYPDLLAAARGLLCEVVIAVKAVGIEFVVIGGWSPYLLNSKPILHPGTRDVDLLFKEGSSSGALNPVFQILKSSGYVRSTKHEFQMLRVLRVSDEFFVFNVDILHADEATTNPELFVDHVSLPIRLSEFSDQTVMARSIRVPVSDFLFAGHVVQYPTASYLPSGARTSVSIPLMDEVGTIVTKAESMSASKRLRDAFDIVLAITQVRNAAELARQLLELARSHPSAFSELVKIRAILAESDLGAKFRSNVARYWPPAYDDVQWLAKTAVIRALLDDAGVPAG